jgi:hypothetical protein
VHILHLDEDENHLRLHGCRFDVFARRATEKAFHEGELAGQIEAVVERRAGNSSAGGGLSCCNAGRFKRHNDRRLRARPCQEEIQRRQQQGQRWPQRERKRKTGSRLLRGSSSPGRLLARASARSRGAPCRWRLFLLRRAGLHQPGGEPACPRTCSEGRTTTSACAARPSTSVRTRASTWRGAIPMAPFFIGLKA